MSNASPDLICIPWSQFQQKDTKITCTTNGHGHKSTTSPAAEELGYQLQLAYGHHRQLASLVKAYERRLEAWSSSLEKLADTSFTAQIAKVVTEPTTISTGILVNDSWQLPVNPLSESLSSGQSPETCLKKAESTQEPSQNAVEHGAACNGDLWPVWRTSDLEYNGHDSITKAADVQDFHFHTVELYASSMAFVSWLDKFLVSPFSPKRITWTLLSLLVITYDLVTLPLTVFKFDEKEYAKRMILCTSTFWTLDMIFCFFSSYMLDDGTIETRFKSVAAQYLKGHFPFDFVICGVDWIMIIGSQTSIIKFARLGKSIRLTRIFRLFRMMRLMRMRNFLMSFETFTISTMMFSLFQIVKLMTGVMVVNHFFACGWYGCGTMNPEDQSWIRMLPTDSAMFDRYLAAYHWSIAQFTPCPTEFRPVSRIERLYAIFMLFVGLVIYSALLGNVTSIVNFLRSDLNLRERESAMLRSFLTDSQVPSHLAHTVTTFLSGRHRPKKKVLEADVSLLNHLPRHLIEEIHYEVHSLMLKAHPLFSFADTHLRGTLVTICHSAALEKYFAKGDEPFYYGKTGTSMLFPVLGTFVYSAGPDALHWSKESTSIGIGQWVTEAPLWMAWEHRGLLAVHDHCSAVDLSSIRFRKSVARHAAAVRPFRHYAVLYATAASQAFSGNVIDDLWGTPAGERHEIPMIELEVMMAGDSQEQAERPSKFSKISRVTQVFGMS